MRKSAFCQTLSWFPQIPFLPKIDKLESDFHCLKHSNPKQSLPKLPTYQAVIWLEITNLEKVRRKSAKITKLLKNGLSADYLYYVFIM